MYGTGGSYGAWDVVRSGTILERTGSIQLLMQSPQAQKENLKVNKSCFISLAFRFVAVQCSRLLRIALQSDVFFPSFRLEKCCR